MFSPHSFSKIKKGKLDSDIMKKNQSVLDSCHRVSSQTTMGCTQSSNAPFEPCHQLSSQTRTRSTESTRAPLHTYHQLSSQTRMESIESVHVLLKDIQNRLTRIETEQDLMRKLIEGSTGSRNTRHAAGDHIAAISTKSMSPDLNRGDLCELSPIVEPVNADVILADLDAHLSEHVRMIQDLHRRTIVGLASHESDKISSSSAFHSD